MNTAPVLIPTSRPDAVFAGDGRLELGFGSPATDDYAYAVAAMADGRLVVAGKAGDDIALARLLANGDLDTSFGVGGRVVTNLSGVDQALGLAVQTDGKVVVAGATDSGSNLALLRYTADGALDSSFGDGGKVLRSIASSTTAERFTKVLVQPDGAIVAAGYTGSTYLIERYTAQGALDTSFSVDGRESAYFSGTSISEIEAIALQNNGKLLVAGRLRSSSSSSAGDFAVARYNADGTLDTSFNGTGKLVWSQTSYDRLSDIQVQGDGKIVLVGRKGPSSSSGEGVVMRLTADGSLDSSFDSDGSASFLLGSDTRFTTLNILANGQILAAGKSDNEALVVRFNADGSLDSGFGTGGALTAEFGESSSAIHDSTLTPEGRWVGAGQSYSLDTAPSGYEFGLLQLGGSLPTQYARAYLGTKRPDGSPTDVINYQIPAGTFHDADGDTLVFSATLADGRALPTWLSFDVATGTLHGKPTVSDFGTHRILITASDGQAQRSELLQVQVDTDFIDGVLTLEDRLNIDAAVGTSLTVTYSFMATNSAATKPVETNTFAPMNEAERAAVREILGKYAAVSGLSFVEIDESTGKTGILRYGTYDDSTVSTSAYARGNSSGSDVWMNRSYIAKQGSVAAGSRPYGTMTHETGHALALKHPGIDPGDQPPFVDQDYGLVDSRTNSILSYTYRVDSVVDIVWEGDDGTYVKVYPSTPMVWDVAALHYLYGVNTTHRSGDDVYTFDPAQPFFKNLWDAGGQDTIDISNYIHDSVVSLVPGTFSSLHTLAAQAEARDYWGDRNLSISYNAIIEHAIGGAGDDVLQGNEAANHLQGRDGNDTLIGGVGDDTLDGGIGLDTAVFSDPRSAFNAQWDSLNNWLVLSAVGQGTDRIMGVETIKFSDASYSVNTLLNNTAPTLTSVSTLTGATEDAAYTITWAALALAANEADSEGDAIAFRVQSVTSGTLTKNGVGVTPGNTAVAGGESLVWTPGANANGTLPAFKVRAVDAVQPSASDVQVSVTVATVNDAPTGAVTISGTAKQGQTLTAANTLADLDVIPASGAGALSYQWKADGQNISGATGSTLVLTQAQLGKAITVAATYTDGGGTTESVTSAATAVVGNVNNTLIGGQGDDMLTGGASDDNITGLAGNDTLDGGLGIDNLQGGEGNDTYVVNVTTDVVTEAADQGIDQVNAAFAAAGTYTLTANVENASVTATVAVNLTGNELDNALTGNAAANILIGGAGNDTLDGGLGIDNLQGGAGDDHYVVNVTTDIVNETATGSSGTDTVRVALTAAGTYVLTANVENASVTALATVAVNLTGNELNNALTGNAAANILIGGAGNDTLDGGLGIDTLQGGAGDDTIKLAETSSAADIVLFRGGIGASGTLDRVSSLGVDTITGFNFGTSTSAVDTLRFSSVDFAIPAGSAVRGLASRNADGNHYVVNSAPTATGVDLNGTSNANSRAIVFVGEAAGSAGVSVWFTVGEGAFSTSNSVLIAELVGVNTANLNASDLLFIA